MTMMADNDAQNITFGVENVRGSKFITTVPHWREWAARGKKESSCMCHVSNSSVVDGVLTLYHSGQDDTARDSSKIFQDRILYCVSHQVQIQVQVQKCVTKSNQRVSKRVAAS
jgi:hypothetical protein